MKYYLLGVLMFIASGLNSYSASIEDPYYDIYLGTKKKVQEVNKRNLLYAQMLEDIKGFEGFRSNAYYCSTGNKTIGYGFQTRYFWQSDTITRQQADSLLTRVFSNFLSLAIENHPKATYREQLLIGHLYYWIGANRVENRLMSDGRFSVDSFLCYYGRYGRRTEYFQQKFNAGVTLDN
jgi:GH24 family phage-related lysozyme (muramidase)